MALHDDIVAALKRVYDPEIPVNIYDLGLIYSIEINAEQAVQVCMTLTAPNCPVAGSLPAYVEHAVRNVDGVTDVTVELTFDPPWSKDRISDRAKLALGVEVTPGPARIMP